MFVVFTICFVIGVVALVGAFAVGEVADLGGGHADGLPFLSLTTLATALFGFGAGGVAATLADAPTLVAAIAALTLAAVLEIGSTSWREKVCQDVFNSWFASS